jgi:alpha-tubulin suppressor-like RCC1 family protein
MRKTNLVVVLGLVAVSGLGACGDDDGVGDNNNNATLDAGEWICGDGELDPGEACDEGSANSDTVADACRTDCRLPRCGDTVTDTDEQCDQGNENSDVEPDACRLDCQAARCGDGIIDSEENCEGDNGGVTCSDLNLVGGDQVICDSACTLDASGCAGCGNTICDTGEGEDPQNCAADCGPQQVAAGKNFTCILQGDGTVGCFGTNEFGQLGNGVATGSNTPVLVDGLDNAIAIAVGGRHACAVRSDNTVWCWGNNSHGQLGDGTDTDSASPVAVVGISNATPTIAAGGEHTCVVLDDGTAACWGQNNRGQLGNDSIVESWTPVAVRILTNIGALAAGLQHTCATQSEPSPGLGTEVYCWGENNRMQLGVMIFMASYAQLPTMTMNLSALIFSHELALGAYHTCVSYRGMFGFAPVYCWGDNGSGALGDGTTENRMEAGDPIPELDDVQHISAGGHRTFVALNTWSYHGHSCAVLGSGAVRCWGENEFGQLGDGSTTDRLSPVDVFGLLNVKYVTAGPYHSCALLSDRTVQCWGANDEGQLGDGSYLSSSTPQPVSF